MYKLGAGVERRRGEESSGGGRAGEEGWVVWVVVGLELVSEEKGKGQEGIGVRCCLEEFDEGSVLRSREESSRTDEERRGKTER
jgi:hypothetical protein